MKTKADLTEINITAKIMREILAEERARVLAEGAEKKDAIYNLSLSLDQITIKKPVFYDLNVFIKESPDELFNYVFTNFHLAIFYGNYDEVKENLKSGACLSIATKTNLNVFDLCIPKEDEDTKTIENKFLILKELFNYLKFFYDYEKYYNSRSEDLFYFEQHKDKIPKLYESFEGVKKIFLDCGFASHQEICELDLELNKSTLVQIFQYNYFMTAKEVEFRIYNEICNDISTAGEKKIFKTLISDIIRYNLLDHLQFLIQNCPKPTIILNLTHIDDKLFKKFCNYNYFSCNDHSITDENFEKKIPKTFKNLLNIFLFNNNFAGLNIILWATNDLNKFDNGLSVFDRLLNGRINDSSDEKDDHITYGHIHKIQKSIQ
jgi:hypothetical protein